jgi:hypothetical protein
VGRRVERGTECRGGMGRKRTAASMYPLMTPPTHTSHPPQTQPPSCVPHLRARLLCRHLHARLYLLPEGAHCKETQPCQATGQPAGQRSTGSSLQAGQHTIFAVLAWWGGAKGLAEASHGYALTTPSLSLLAGKWCIK